MELPRFGGLVDVPDAQRENVIHYYSHWGGVVKPEGLRKQVVPAVGETEDPYSIVPGLA